MGNLNISFLRNGTNLSVMLSGPIDHHEAKIAREKIDREITECNISYLELDLSDIDFMDSAGLGLILGRYTRMCSRNGGFAVINPSKAIMRIITMAGADKYINVIHKAPSAIQ